MSELPDTEIPQVDPPPPGAEPRPEPIDRPPPPDLPPDYDPGKNPEDLPRM